MTAIVFTGPTLSADEARRACDALCLPPVAQGDVYRATQRNPSAIGIIDGYFSGAPSVWHKEILYALSRSIPVFGSASMGALRAAELHVFGMQGVGLIFEAYRDGRLEDDDEVAVIHGPPETGFIPLSEAMVNVRATLARATAEKVISVSSSIVLEARAKALFFHQRDWPVILEKGSAQGIWASEIDALRSWLPEGRVDQKREDALAMLAALREAGKRLSPQGQGFHFEWTHFWDEMIAREAAIPSTLEDDGALASDFILDELRLSNTEAHQAAKARAVVKLNGEARWARRAPVPGPEALRAELARLRTEHRLFTRAELDAWISRNDLDEASLERLLRGRIHFGAAMERQGGPSFDLAMLDELRLGGAYEELAARARAKRQALESGAAKRGRAPSDVEKLAARLRFIESRLGRAPHGDVGAIARELGFRDLDHLDRALRDDRDYIRLTFPDGG